MSGDSFDFTGLTRWQRFLIGCQKEKLHEMKSRIVRTAGMRFLEVAEDRTPVRTGRLKGSLTVGDRDNIFQVRVAHTSEVRAGTAVKYAKHVNDGFTQRRGQFVPGEWRSGHFHYIPGYKDANGKSSGLVLKGAVVPGAHFCEKGVAAVEEDMPRIIEFEIRRLFDELNGRG